jgi:hypothetical protein
LRPTITVSIGLDKNTKLSAVFNRYVEFCNEATGNERIYVSDLEFAHCQLLNGGDTAEISALMKNDKVKVRGVRTSERKQETERKGIQREADRNYFSQLRHLMGKKTADIILDCQGKLLDENGRNQQVLCTEVRAHSAILGKRCPWLGAIIQKARSEAAAKRTLENISTPEFDDEEKEEVIRVESERKTVEEEKEDDSIEVLSYSPKDKGEGELADESSGANEIENDDDEDEDQPFNESRNAEDQNGLESPVVVPSEQEQTTLQRNLLVVTIPQHSPEAIKLLLEYCYTNRVVSLGQESFTKSCKTKPTKRRWPNNGYPMVPFSVALAGIALAEEAFMHRLSLMCEIAAAQLITPGNVVEALSICTSQKSISGNDLPKLRKASMEILLSNGARGVTELDRTPSFRMALDERRADIVPTLLQGTTEAVTSYEKSRGNKRTKPCFSSQSYDELDRKDSFKREKERRKRRKQRREDGQDRPFEIIDDLEDFEDLYDNPNALWETLSDKRSLKRMSHHLDSMRQRAFGSGGRRLVLNAEVLNARVLNARAERFGFTQSLSSSRRSSSSRRRGSHGESKR